MSFNEIIDYTLIRIGEIEIKLESLLVIAAEIISCWFILFIIRRIIGRIQKKRNLDKGRMSAFYQIAKYLIITATALIIMESMGIDVKVLLVGSTALLVGLGLGIQQTFQDIVSGVIILFEGTFRVGDIVEVDGVVGVVRKIQLRTSEVVSRDQINIIIPNHKLVSEKVINWSYNRKNTRFHINIGVAYGSDPVLVKRLLEEAASEHHMVTKTPEPVARFENFGDSALEFKLFFYSHEMLAVEFVKSDIRFKINQKLKENNITIPFPQRDIHIKGGNL